RRHLVAPALAALDLTANRHLRDVSPQLGDPGPDPAPVRLDLGLARTPGPDATAAGHPATGLPGQRFTPAAQSRQHVLHLRQLDLGLAFLALGVLSEDVQDQRGPVDDLDLHDAFQLPQLAWRQLAVADHRVRPGRRDQFGQLAGLARTHVGRRVRPA